MLPPVSNRFDSTKATRNGASLRDPAGYVFEYSGSIFRRLTSDATESWRSFSATYLSSQLMEEGVLIRTQVAIDIEPALCVPMDCPGTNPHNDYGLILSHERVPIVTYPQEWCFSMLRDVALLHLELMSNLLPAGWTIKDANPSNFQWMNGKMTLIDVTSIEPYKGGPWRAYGQFCRTMLFPLLVSAYGRLPLQPLLKGYVFAGIDSATASGLISFRSRFKPGVFTHVLMQSWLQELANRGLIPDSTSHLTAGVGPDAVLRMVAGLRRIIEAMPTPGPTKWTDYRVTSTYSEDQLSDKRNTIDRWCAKHMRHTELAMDVGCNTGKFSEVLAGHTEQVLSIDADMACIDALYRSAVPGVLPLVVDVAAPTPSAGWALSEQQSFTQRARPEWSLWLAVIHHLAIHNGVRLDEVVRCIVGTSAKFIVEFIAPEDDMVHALLTERGVERRDYTTQNFLALLNGHGLQVIDSHIVTATRTLYLVMPKNDQVT